MYGLPSKAIQVRDEVEAFFNARALPNKKLWVDQARAGQSINLYKINEYVYVLG
jgi:hypothetical protein